MTRVRRRDYSKLTRNIKRIPTCFLHVCSNDPLESLQQRNNPGAFRRRTTTSRSRVGPRERLDPLCKQGKPYPSATSACRSSAEALTLPRGANANPSLGLGVGFCHDDEGLRAHLVHLLASLTYLQALVGRARCFRGRATCAPTLPTSARTRVKQNEGA
jgi:hypothetical protein